LTSPAGTVSRLVGQHFDNGANYADWTFTSVRHWGEWAVGSWTVRIADRSAGDVGTLNSVTVRLYGSLAPGARMAPAGTTLLAESLLPANAAVDPGETVAISVGIRNTGTTAATNLTASLLALGGVSSPGPDQDYGILAPGTTAWRPFTFTASGACGAGATALFRLQAGSRPLGVLSVPVNLGRSTTTNVDSSGGITIPSQGAGVPSPSTITVGGLTGRLQRISARLSGVTHTYLHDISTALVAPGGLHLLLQDSGTKSAVSGLTWTFDDSASTYIPGNVSASGTYRPFDYYDAVPPAVPEGEIAFTLGEFLGTPPAGTWRLYVDDSGAGDSGSISGWRLSLTTVDCADNVLFGATSHLADETNGVLAVAVLRTSGRDGAATVNYATSNGTATAGSDYVATSGTLAFAAGETSKTVNVTLMNDALWEGSESFSIRLWGAGGVACLGSSTSTIVTVRDGDFDRDGMPDDWETVNGLAWDNANDGALDADGDRLPNIAEYVADRDPNDPSSYLGLTCVHPTGGFARVEWVGGTLARQWLESRTNLASGATWKPILTNEPPTAVTNRFLDRSATNGLPYYRVRVQRD
jgi:subtilisin-like proprotein convertase family protein